ncbi:MAG TPA: hypothetical protein VFY78_00600 [Gammaproteobacteria bacterium]|nr:hypothetical protein [Gammaproteobacteria bacterium]
MATYVPAKRGVEYIFYVSLVQQADTKLFQSNPTLAAGDVVISKDGGATANLTTLPTVTPASSKSVKVTLSATEMTADNVLVIFSDAAGAQWCDLSINIHTAARQIDDLAYPATSGRSMVVDAAGLVDATTVKLGPSGTAAAQTAKDLGADVDGIAKNTALNNFEFLMIDSTDGKTPKTGLTITATRSIDGAAFAACANSATEVASGIYKINLANTDLNGDVITFRFTGTGALDRFVTVKTNA